MKILRDGGGDAKILTIGRIAGGKVEEESDVKRLIFSEILISIRSKSEAISAE